MTQSKQWLGFPSKELVINPLIDIVGKPTRNSLVNDYANPLGKWSSIYWNPQFPAPGGLVLPESQLVLWDSPGCTGEELA